jgi:hypothetical protein
MEAVTMEAAQSVTEAVAKIGGRETLRLAAVMNALEAQGLSLDDEGTAARDAQLRAIKALIDGDDSISDVLAFARMLTPNALLQNAVADAIVLAWKALDGDALALDVIEAQDEAPAHKAVCMVDGCPAEVLYTLTASGSGFVVIGRRGMDLDATLGIGADGRPICPIDEAHGEMTLADETIPAADAFAQVADKLKGAQQVALPGVFPAFNYAGAFNEIVEQAKRVEWLNSEYDEAKKAASEAKKDLDKGAELLMRMTLQFEQRRREKPESDGATCAAPTSRALLCMWDQQHPDEACPFCDPALTIEQRAEIVRVLGEEILPMEANGHADQVVTYRTKLDVAETVDALAGFVYDVHPATIAEWSPEERAAVRTWLADPDGTFETRPAILGRPHLALRVDDAALVQTCSACGAVLRMLDDGATEALPAGAMVRTDCAGTEAEGHRYPEPATAQAKQGRKAPQPKKAAKKRAAKKTAKK